MVAGGVINSIFVVAIASRFSYRASDYVELSEGGIAFISVQGSHTLPWGTIALLHVTRTGALELSDSNRLASALALPHSQLTIAGLD